MALEGAITIRKETCKKCNLCAEVCPNKIFRKNAENEMSVREDRAQVCFKCGQCMAICSTKSVIVNGLSYEGDFFDLTESASLETAFNDLITTRRAIRNFKDKPVPKEMLEKIVKAISFAPPGFPPLKTEVIIVQDREIIKKALPHMIALYDKLMTMLKNPLIRFFIKKEVGRKKYHSMQNHLIPLLRTRMPELKTGAEDTITRNAPAMILFHYDDNSEDIQSDINIAATYGILAAHAIGLGGSIMEIIPPAINKSKELRDLLGIPANHSVLSSIIVGYPKFKYKRGIKRSLNSVRWL